MRFKRANFKTLTAGAVAAIALSSTAFADQPVPGGYWLQDSATPVMEELTKVHGMVFVIICLITLFVTVLMAYIMIRFREKANPVPSKTTHHVGLEIAWTIAPVAILLVMVGPSMQLLYMQDRLPETDMTVKAIGNTWNWEYAYPDFENVESFVSNPLDKTEATAKGVPYLLGTDNALIVPVDTKVKVLITSVNNMHAWTVPSFGLKMDAVPGMINEAWFEATREGVFYGQCSEICGAKHYNMPIEVNVVSKAEFNRWVANGGSFGTQSAAINSIATSVAAPK